MKTAILYTAHYTYSTHTDDYLKRERSVKKYLKCKNVRVLRPL